jgi:hypothetical protein
MVNFQWDTIIEGSGLTAFSIRSKLCVGSIILSMRSELCLKLENAWKGLFAIGHQLAVALFFLILAWNWLW